MTTSPTRRQSPSPSLTVAIWKESKKWHQRPSRCIYGGTARDVLVLGGDALGQAHAILVEPGAEGSLLLGVELVDVATDRPPAEDWVPARKAARLLPAPEKRAAGTGQLEARSELEEAANGGAGRKRRTTVDRRRTGSSGIDAASGVDWTGTGIFRPCFCFGCDCCRAVKGDEQGEASRRLGVLTACASFGCRSVSPCLPTLGRHRPLLSCPSPNLCLSQGQDVDDGPVTSSRSAQAG